ncbi:DUF1641 domain-containing protein [Bacillus sp. HMF5848]|uniref:DUF1641 domain-containing protein n=1 Tax=Bacillus sp. HMF5848 TaxID=2495421 RepID=UPI000F76C954|nr:DUF1641 domain-containing protein [Bacillus sp. HMF5848]RSK29039.1 DUF1641 domain-containing protein [Bacillus sp. HMF5848]
MEVSSLEHTTTMEYAKELIEVAIQSMTKEMVDEITKKAIASVELIDDIAQPETIELLKKLPDVSESLSRSLDEIKKLEQTGSLQTLIEVAEMIAAAKVSMTSTMVLDIVEKAIAGVELADDLTQKGAIPLATNMIASFTEAMDEYEDKQPLSLLQLAKSMKDPNVRKGLSILVSFLKRFANG